MPPLSPTEPRNAQAAGVVMNVPLYVTSLVRLNGRLLFLLHMFERCAWSDCYSSSTAKDCKAPTRRMYDRYCVAVCCCVGGWLLSLCRSRGTTCMFSKYGDRH